MINPYAAPAQIDDVPLTDFSEANIAAHSPPEVSLRWSITRWTLVCLLAAAPSFVVGLNVTEGKFAGMLTGILIFIAVYVRIDRSTMRSAWRRSLRVRRTLTTVYILRIVATIIYPIGMMMDMMCGIVSITLTQWPLRLVSGEAPGPPQMGFVQSLATTLVQGVMLNLVLLIFALVLYPLVALATRRSN